MNSYKNGHDDHCDIYTQCKVMVVPYVVSEILGGGWTFPKKSFLLPIFSNYWGFIKESGTYYRIESSYNNRQGMPPQDCVDNEGKPIGITKVFSLFGILLILTGLSFLIFM